jgi:uncharacterized membrane protein
VLIYTISGSFLQKVSAQAGSDWQIFPQPSVYCRTSKKQMSKGLGTAYQGFTHTKPNMFAIAWKVASKIQGLFFFKKILEIL